MLSLLLAASVLAGPPVDAPSAKPVTAAYYYKVRWGFQQEFERLFFANHFPLLKAQKASGRMKDVLVFKPTYHGDGHADWTFLVVITYSNWAAFQGVPGEEDALIKKLYPDQEKYKKEEQRRFEILDAHWDVPLAPVEPPQ
ncbi:MAG: hypothetical protein ACHQNV_05340 [Vicinamibacteria bacterium]